MKSKMKKTILLIMSLIFISSLYAQETTLKKYVVYFSDKGTGADANINPSSYLADKAVERRLKQQLSFDLSDVPVNEEYVKNVSNTGAKVIARSRWFNWVVIEATQEIVDQMTSLSFVTKIQKLDKEKNTQSEHTSGKAFFEVEKIRPAVNSATKKVTTDVYDYGIAYNQINQLKGQYLHNNGYSGQGMTIAVIDAGFNSVDIMPCFDSLRANNQIKGTRDFAQPGNNVYANTMHWHGTSVLSCMGAYVSGQMIGTAPKADYWLLRSEVGASESIIEEYYWVSAAEFADSIGADLINSSLGYTEFDDPSTNHTYADMDGNTTVVTTGADKAAEKGILVVNSAGNSGGGGWWYIGAPADGDSVFSIGAVDAFGARAYFSSVGPTYDRRIKPTVAAQGLDAALFFPEGLGYGSGTSFSSPITCGITACFWQALPDLNNMQIIEAVKAAASQASEPDSLLGWGIPDYEKSYTTLSIRDEATLRTLVTYPNPVSDRLTIGFPTLVSGDFNIEIINLQGKTIYARQGNEGIIRSLQIKEISELPSGIYLVKVSNKSFIFSGKFIKI
jgi:serine protease AprX